MLFDMLSVQALHADRNEQDWTALDPFVEEKQAEGLLAASTSELTVKAQLFVVVRTGETSCAALGIGRPRITNNVKKITNDAIINGLENRDLIVKVITNVKSLDDERGKL